jgi:hypothetical protein
MIVLLFVLVMECVSLVNVYVILSGKALIVIFIILVLVRIIVEIEESVDMEDVSVILDLVETSVNLVKHVLIIVIIEEFVDMELVSVKRVILVMTVNLLNQIRENFVKIIAIIEEIV